MISAAMLGTAFPKPPPPPPVTAGRLYSVDFISERVYEHDLNSMLDISGGGTVGPGPANVSAIGGFFNRLFTYTQDERRWFELDPVTRLDITGGGHQPTGSATYLGGGGTDTTAYWASNASNFLQVFNPNTLEPIGPTVASPGASPSGIGGTGLLLFSCDLAANRVYSLDPVSMLDTSGGGVVAPGSQPTGVGGTNSRVYLVDQATDRMYELDTVSMLDVSGGGVVTPATDPRGVGGTTT